MIIESIYIKEGLFDREIKFNSFANLVHSTKNGCGKTTLLRLVLYGLGYAIPNTKGINFNKCNVELCLNTETNGRIKLSRNDKNIIVIYFKGGQETYVLPERQNELHARLFGTENIDILENLLGAFYIDQEKGWTLLNRGIVIGSIHFNIDSLIRGLSNRDCSEYIKKERQLSRDREKYLQMDSVALYRESLEEEAGSLATDSYTEESTAKRSALLIEERQYKNELKRIDKTLSSNNQFQKYVDDMKLLVRSPRGETFTVTSENILGLTDAIALLVAKRKMVSADYAKIISQIEQIESEMSTENEQESFLETASQVEIFDREIMRLPLNIIAIKKEISRLDKEIKATRENITELTRKNNSVVQDITKSVISYAKELGVGDEESITASYIFTSNLKELSGAYLHKTIFAFRLAYIIAIEKVLNIKLPIILDSPSGKEVDRENVSMMMNILKRDFKDHQIIIASIFTYDFDNINTIELEDKLINQMIQV